MVEGNLARPNAAQDLHVFAAAVVALLLGQVVAVRLSLDVAGAGDDVDARTPATRPVERREHARGHGRRDEARAMRDHEFQRLRHRRDVRGGRERIGPGRRLPDEDAVEARLLVRDGIIAQKLRVVYPAHRMGLGGIREEVKADDFEGHYRTSIAASRSATLRRRAGMMSRPMISASPIGS